MREDRGDVEAAGALHVHEERVGGLHQPLQLVPALLELTRRVQQVNVTHGDERHAARSGACGPLYICMDRRRLCLSVWEC